jgi:hypothetical protein
MDNSPAPLAVEVTTAAAMASESKGDRRDVIAKSPVTAGCSGHHYATVFYRMVFALSLKAASIIQPASCWSSKTDYPA